MAEKYAVISPVDLDNPFQNPTEEPEYSPDYRALVPGLDQPGAVLPLMPTHSEKSNIRKMFSLTFLSLMFAFFTSATVYTALTLGLPLILRIIDMQREGSLPENYPQIVSQYFSDSGINMSITLLAFFIGNLSGFWVGCRLTHLSWKDFFRTRRLTFPRTLLYIVIGLWIQLLTSEAGSYLMRLSSAVGISLRSPSLSVEGSKTRLAVTLLYACLIAPITEELLFRGLLLKNAARVGQRFAIFLSAFFFAMAHQNVLQFLLTLPLGIFLGYITIRHNSLVPSVTVHILLNSAAMLLTFGESLLPTATFRTAYTIYSLAVLGIGTAAFAFFTLTQRLPDRTPHQGFRCFRIAATSPLFWALICAYLIGTIMQ